VHLSSLQSIIWVAGPTLKVILCLLVFVRGLHRRLPLFGVYAALLVAETIAVRFTYHHWGYASEPARYVYWSSLGVVLFARALAVGELSWKSLRNAPAVWGIVRKPLVVLAAAFVIYAAIAASKSFAFLLTAERRLDLGVVVIITALTGLGVRYKVWLGAIERKIVLGFGVYSAFQVVNDAFMQKWMMRYFQWWASASMVSFEIAMLIWIAPLVRPLPPPAPAPKLFSEEESVAILGPALERLRGILEEMKRIARSKWK
jgi:hypothetical protein